MLHTYMFTVIENGREFYITATAYTLHGAYQWFERNYSKTVQILNVKAC